VNRPIVSLQPIQILGGIYQLLRVLVELKKVAKFKLKFNSWKKKLRGMAIKKLRLSLQIRKTCSTASS